MLATQTLPNPSSGTSPQRPFSWCLLTSPTSSASSTNLFLDDLDTEDSRPPIGKHLRRVQQVEDDQSLPPVLPAGFRNFSRYLDTKFGPDSSSVSLENIDDHENSQQDYSQLQHTYENQAVNDHSLPNNIYHKHAQSGSF